MKNYLIPLALLFIVACSKPKKETPVIAGAYNMISHTNTAEDGTVTNSANAGAALAGARAGVDLSE